LPFLFPIHGIIGDGLQSAANNPSLSL